MTKEKLHEEYQQWIEDEKNIAANSYNQYKSTAGTGLVPVRPWRTRKQSFIIRAAAAILILALGTTMWIKRDDIFKPKYTQEQIALSYEHAVKALAVCANSLSTEMNKLQKLDQIPKSIDNLKQLGNAINN